MSYIRKKLLILVFMTFFNLINSSMRNHKNIQLSKPQLPTITRSKRATDQVKSTLENTTDYRLPDNVVPKEYFIQLNPFIIPDNFTFDGIVKIIANVKKTTSTIILHMKDIEVNDIAVRNFNEDNEVNQFDTLYIVDTRYIKKYEFFNITLESSVEVGTNISIDISYTGKLNDDMRGFYRSSYKIGNETRWIAATQLAPTAARMLFPCFDEPALKAVFYIKVVLPPYYIALSNMPVKHFTIDNIVEFERTPLMSTYLVAVAVCDFESESIYGNQPWLYRVWSSKNLVDQLPYALSIMPEKLDFLSNQLGVPYALPKLDMIALPDFDYGAMENWGLIAYREASILYDSNVTSLSQKLLIHKTITHEIAHQWFGNLVTPSWWDHMWLSEGFASYFEEYTYDNATSSWNLEDDFVVERLQPSFLDDALSNTHPMTNKVYSPVEIVAMYDSITYSKGASIIRMLEKILGSQIFFAALRRYIQSNKYSIGTPDLLCSAIEEELKINDYKLNAKVSDVMKSWTLQSGYPVINVRFTGDTVIIKQQRFFLKPPGKSDRTVWFVPLNWATYSNPNFNDTRKITWLNKNQFSITIRNASTDWVIFNIQQTGYYRVNYDENMWKRIIELLKSNDYETIHEINRASLIDDLFNLARVGMVNYNTTLTGSQYLIQEASYIPWKAAFAGLKYLKNRLIGHSEIYNFYKNYVISLLKPSYERLGFNEMDGERDSDILLRELVLQWLCKLEYEECVQKSLDAFKKMQINNSYSLSPNQQSFIYCTAIKHGLNESWNYLWQKLEESQYSNEKLTILSGLACSENSTSLQRLLLEAITPDQSIKKQDLKRVFANVIGNGLIGVQSTLEFIENNYNKMYNYINNDQTVASIFSTLSKFISTKEHLQKLDDFITNNKRNISSIYESLQNSLEDSKFELNWYEKNAQNIFNWLKVHSD